MSDNTLTRLGQINLTGATDALFLKFYAETLAALQRTTQFIPRTYVRTISQGKSAQFPLVGRAGAAYHTPGTEITGSTIPQNERVITIDGLMISHVSIAEIDEAMNHYDLRSIFTSALGEALAIAVDANIGAVGILAARSAGWHASMPGGSQVVSATSKTDSEALIASIFQSARLMDEKYVPDVGRVAFLKPAQYALLAQNTKVMNKDWGGAGVYADGKVLKIDNVEIVKAMSLPTTNVAGTFGNKYNVDATNTSALVMRSDAAGTVKLIDMKLESDGFDVRRQSTLMVAKMAVGHGVLRPECAVEVVTA